MLKLILAVSADNLLATGPDDDMGWTGSTDKKLFRLLTSVGAVCGVGTRTWVRMPELEGRQVIPLSRRRARVAKDLPLPLVSFQPAAVSADLVVQTDEAWSLGQFAHHHPEGWLLGGPTLAMEALSIDLVDQVYLCRSPMHLGEGIRDEVTPWLMAQGERQNAGIPWRRVHRIKFDDVVVDCWSRMDARRS